MGRAQRTVNLYKSEKERKKKSSKTPFKNTPISNSIPSFPLTHPARISVSFPSVPSPSSPAVST
ncbi:hypothetical protein E2C01_101301 [Portunus trituberculatus]|uniref:Uncharacterized protein n=1 Tax=Portunus trituberculatus TaxID=210409 RepID=A0A5B7K5C8_PORTR|nr:hypothetical protein [Portunus trituberculatus]